MNNNSSDFLTAQELLKYGYTFSELQYLARAGQIGRRHRVTFKGDDVYTFSESDLIKYRDRTEVKDGNDAN